MKIILTGSTGTVGSGVLSHCISHPSITSIVALTRRPIETKDPKLHNIIKTDYLTYTPSEIAQLQGAEACIWVLGAPTSGKEVHIDYTKAAMKMMLESIVPGLGEAGLGKGKVFRFVYVSGGLVPYLASKPIAMLAPPLKLRDELDTEILATSQQAQNVGRWETFVARPWFVVDEKPYTGYILGANSWILRTELAAAMVEVALNGGEPRLMSNTFMRVHGRKALDKLKL